jgi:zinc/manganese transport system permease protein
MLLRRNMGARIAVAWALGALATFLGVYLSVLLDLPTGATMVCTFAGVLVVVAVIRAVGRFRLA